MKSNRKKKQNIPFMYLVAEYMQISAPKARGRYGRKEGERCLGRVVAHR